MNCQTCGNRLDEAVRFCANCGAASPLQPKTEQNALLTRIIGLVLILGGVLPLLLRFGGGAFLELAARLMREGHDYRATAALNGLQYIAGFGESLFSFPCCGLAVLTGALLLKGRDNGRRMLLLTAVFYALSLLRKALVVLVLYGAPRKALSLILWDEEVIEIGAELMERESGILAALIPQFWLRLVLELALLALCILALVKCEKPARAKKYGSLGISLMLPMLALLSAFSAAFTTARLNAYGDLMMVANSTASAVFSRYIGTACALLLCAWIFLAVLLPETKSRFLLLPAVGTVLLLGAAALLLTKPLLLVFSPPHEIVEMALSQLRGMVVNAVVMLIALFLWCSAVGKKRLPLWLQILLPVALPFVCIIWDGVAMALLQWEIGISLGLLRCAWITVAVSLLVRKRTAIS